MPRQRARRPSSSTATSSGVGDRRRGIPSPTAAGFLAVYDSQTLVGTLVERDHSHFAFASTGELIGEYRTRLEAVRALPRVSGSAL
jgi:hypothetical protein